MTNELPQAFPLQWPTGWPRTKSRRRAQFGRKDSSRPDYMNPKARLTVAAALARLSPELARLGAQQVVVSTNVELRKSDQMPRSDRPEPRDPGVAVYFRLKKEPRVLACDRWDRVADNIAAVAAHVAALRGIDRWGVGTMEQAFAGYKALAAAGAVKPWWETLGFREDPRGFGPALGDAYDVVRAKYRALIAQHHPDRGGNPNQAAEINAAWEQAQKKFGQ